MRSSDKKYNQGYLQELLSLLKLDKEYREATGNYLYSYEGNDKVRYLDLAGGYGSLLLGHNHPEIVNTATKVLDQNVCFHHQLSVKPNLNRLCKKINDLINERTGSGYNITILNTGAEAVEAAIKHSLLGFYKRLEEYMKEREKALVGINEMYFKRNPKRPLSYNGVAFDSVEDLRLYMESLDGIRAVIDKPKVVISNRSFHGKTLGALSVTSNAKFRSPFIKNSTIEPVFLDIHSENYLEIFEENVSHMVIPYLTRDHRLSFKRRKFNLIAAVLIEPIIGEGGIHVVPKKFLGSLRDHTKSHNIPLIFDEIQSGCFRTGHFLASFIQEIDADYYILGKALGGGLSKISALAIDEAHYIPEFDLLHSSTFAEDDYSSIIALKSIDLLIDNKSGIRGTSDYIFRKLNALQDRYPNIINEVRGSGLMIGINFRSLAMSSSYGLQGVYRSQYFGYILSAYLLNEWQIRVSVTLSDSYTLRLLPSLYIKKTQVDLFIKALTELCKILEYGDFYSLISFLLPPNYQRLRPVRKFKTGTVPLDDVSNCKQQVGFLLHYIDINTVRSYLPSLDLLPDEVVLTLIRMIIGFSEPVVIGRNRIKNNKGEKICITFIGLSFTAKMINDDIKKSISKLYDYQSKCEKAIDLLYSMGIKSIGLGQYNSIIMQNGKAVSNADVRVTTGNSFTAYTVLEKLKNVTGCLSGGPTKIGIVGAAGNIGKIIALKIISRVGNITLFGRTHGNRNKLMDHGGSLINKILADILKGSTLNNEIYEEIRNFSESMTNSYSNDIELWNAYKKWTSGNSKIEIETNLDKLNECNIVVVATSDSKAFLNKSHFRKGTLIIDISVPLNCDQELLNDPDYTVIKGGVVDLPNAEALHPPGLNLKKGQAFACMVETMLMGFENAKGSYSFGELLEEQTDDIGKRVKDVGFVINTPKTALTP